MAVYESTPNIVVDENFLMLEKRLRRKYAAKATVYSNAEAIEQERKGARAYAIAPEAYGDSKFIGGIPSSRSSAEGNVKYMTTEDYVAYFERCHDTFGAMDFNTVAPAVPKTEEAPKILVNRKKVEQIKKINAAKQATKTKVRPQTADAKRKTSAPAQIESSKLDAFFTKLSKVKGRALASVAAFAICCTVAVGGMAFRSEETNVGENAPMERLRSVEQVEENNEGHTSLLSVLE